MGITHDPKRRRVGFGRLVGIEQAKLLGHLRRNGLERLNFMVELSHRPYKLMSASVISPVADTLIIDKEGRLLSFWTGVVYPTRAPLSEDEMMFLRMIAP